MATEELIAKYERWIESDKQLVAKVLSLALIPTTYATLSESLVVWGFMIGLFIVDLYIVYAHTCRVKDALQKMAVLKLVGDHNGE